jgi:hypothetical protein
MEVTKVLWYGKVYFNGGLQSIDCKIRSISAKGAKLEIEPSTPIPDGFELYIPERDRRYKANLVWRDAKNVEVQFLERYSKNDQGDEVSDLEEKNRRLRSAVKTLSERLENLGVDVSLLLERLNNS